jgi:4-carboxymuconolactone decarboxylase
LAALSRGSAHSARERLPALAKQNGLTETELKEAIVHLAFYSGWPKAMSAIQVAKQVFAE